MIKTTAIALIVALATFAPPAAIARPHSGHWHLAGAHVTKTLRDPGYARSDTGYAGSDLGYARTAPVGPNWGSECVTDEGEGRFFPCDGH
jgi:hypothetical protein